MAKKRQRHGLRALKARVMVSGLAVVDMRTAAAKEMIGFRLELENALGGRENISPQKATLLEMIVRTKLILNHCDAFVLSQPSLINRRRKGFLPIVRERQSLCESLAKLMGQLGMNFVPKPVPALADYIAQFDAEKAERAEKADAAPTEPESPTEETDGHDE